MDCRAPAQLLCSLQDTCSVSFFNDINVADCGDKLADYLAIEYRFIPSIFYSVKV